MLFSDELLYFIVLLALILILILLLISLANGIIDEYFDNKYSKQFSKDIKDALINSEPSWEEIKDIALVNYISRSKAFYILLRYQKDILTGKEKELKNKESLIKSYIMEYRKDEPFEGIPDDIKIHLERIREKIPHEQHLIEPLTTQMKELLSVYRKDKKQQQRYTIGGFFIGLLGFIFAITSYFITPMEKNTKIESSINTIK